VQVIGAEDFENAFHYVMMFFEGGREDHDVFPEDVVHHRLECRWGVGKTEEHDRRLKEPAVSPKGGLPFISFLDADVVISPAYVQLGENLRVLEFVH
ncbi:hypothetical protein HYDPIDRAFT_101119, partial [Hydnomerulius pinastri MD-312]